MARNSTDTNIAEGASTEIDKLQELLSRESVPKTVLASNFGDFSEAAKNGLLERLAQTRPPHPGRLLARLLFIRTAVNEVLMRQIFVANLRAEEPEARRFSLYGLQTIGHPALVELALQSLNDKDDAVLTAAINVLLPHAKDPHISSALRALYRAHRGDPGFYMSLGFLSSNGFAGDD